MVFVLTLDKRLVSLTGRVLAALDIGPQGQERWAVVAREPGAVGAKAALPPYELVAAAADRAAAEGLVGSIAAAISGATGTHVVVDVATL